MLFAPKKVDPKQQVREMKRNVTKEIRKIEREILGSFFSSSLLLSIQ